MSYLFSWEQDPYSYLFTNFSMRDFLWDFSICNTVLFVLLYMSILPAIFFDFYPFAMLVAFAVSAMTGPGALITMWLTDTNNHAPNYRI